MTTIYKLTPIIVRIIMRYISGAIGTTGIVVLDDVQAVLAVLVAAALAAIVEVWHVKVMRNPVADASHKPSGDE